MKTRAGSGPPLLAVQRAFECNRLAEEFQARAYEQVLPLDERVSTAAVANQVDVGDGSSQQIIPEEIAA